MDFGQACDHNLPSPDDEPPCHVCEPGTECVGTVKGQGTCVSRCEVDANCPCDATCENGFCRPCRELREECDSWHPCCEEGTECGSGGTCCRSRGSSCEASGDCCSGDRCVAGLCKACQKIGAGCLEDNECCGGMSCTNGLCTPHCPGESTECHDVEDQTGACNTGVWSCPPGARPECVQTVFPVPEICDGVDNDCNGYVDDGLAEPACPGGQVQTAQCQAGFTVPGKLKCIGGTQECIAEPCDTSDPNAKDCYCTMNGAAIGGNGKPCGEAGATTCIPGLTMCTPNSACVSGDTVPQKYECREDKVCDSIPVCWTPDDVQLPPNHCYDP
ncbi:MAG: Dickkopf N-terminal cysteine-rich domain-containing protein [Myxococcota bacterium]